MAIDGGPELVQLLTPEGVLVEHPDYALTLTDEQWRGRYEDLVMVRRLDTEATALQRHGELGLWAPCQGQEAAQVGAAHATRPSDRIFPTYREHGMAWVRGVDPRHAAGTVPRHDAGRLGPGRARPEPLHDRHRRPDACTPSATRWGSSATAPTTRRWCASVTAPRRRATSPRRSCTRRSTTRPWSSSARTTSGRSPSRWSARAGSRSTGARPDSASPASGWTATTCWPCRRSSPPRWTGRAPAAGPTLVEAFTYRMGAHTTSDDPTRYRTTAEGEAWKLKDPIERVRAHMVRSGIADRGVPRRRGCARRGARRAAAGRLPGPAGSAADRHVRAPLRHRASGGHPRARAGSATYLAGFADAARRAAPMTVLTMAKALNAALAAAMSDDPRVLVMGEDVGRLGGVFRVTDGLQARFGDRPRGRHAAGRERHHRHGRRAGDARLRAGVPRSSSTGSSSRPSTRSPPRSPACTCAPAGRWRCAS